MTRSKGDSNAVTVPAGEGDLGSQERRSDAELAAKPGELPPLGTLLDGKYRLEGELGAGSMGVAYLARDEVLDRPVAIKFIRARRAGSARSREQLVLEAQAMARLRHENVVSVYALGDLHGLPYFVMEYIAGSSLDAWLLGHDGDVAPDDVLAVMKQVCAGADAIHAVGAVHCDLKPSNVLVGAGFRLAVSDLGLAQLLGPEDRQRSATGGTPEYIAPEVVTGDELPRELMPSRDVYSLGVMAFQLLTGRLPFEDGAPTEILTRQVMKVPPKVRGVRKDLPEQVDAIIARSLSKDPAARQRSAGELYRELEAALRGAETAAARTLLIADDDEDFRMLVRTVVESELPELNVLEAPNGAAALEQLDAVPVDVALVDLQMPRLNGLEVIAARRVSEAQAQTRFVVLTAVGGAADWRVLLELGASAFLPKPVRPKDLVRTIQRLLGSKG